MSADGSQLLSTGVQVQAGNPQNLGLAAHLRIAADAVKRQVLERYTNWDAGMEISKRWTELKAAAARAEADGSEPSPPSTTTIGNKVGLTLLIDFSDDQATVSQAEIINFCNGVNYTGFGNNGSVRQYYFDVSSGRLTYTNVVTIYIRAPHPKTYYNDTSKDCATQGRLLVNDALTVMKALPNYTTDILPTFNNLTVDGQNQVVACNVFFAGNNSGVWPMGLWPNSFSLANAVELSAGGKKVYRCQICNVGTSPKIGTFCHENGHMLCGYPDLYDYVDQTSAGAGDYCLMADGSWGGGDGSNPSQVCAYLKRASGWATTTELTSLSSLVGTVTSLPGAGFNGFYRYAKPGVSTEYFLVECRNNTSHDAALPGSGVLVWHIDELGHNSAHNLNPNTTHNNYEATVVQADNLWDLEHNNNNGDANDLYYNGNPSGAYNNQLTDASSPNAHYWDGTDSGIHFSGFSPSGATMTFQIGVGGSLSAPILSHEPPVTPGTENTIYWSAVAAAPSGSLLVGSSAVSQGAARSVTGSGPASTPSDSAVNRGHVEANQAPKHLQSETAQSGIESLAAGSVMAVGPGLAGANLPPKHPQSETVQSGVGGLATRTFPGMAAESAGVNVAPKHSQSKTVQSGAGAVIPRMVPTKAGGSLTPNHLQSETVQSGISVVRRRPETEHYFDPKDDRSDGVMILSIDPTPVPITRLDPDVPKAPAKTEAYSWWDWSGSLTIPDNNTSWDTGYNCNPPTGVPTGAYVTRVVVHHEITHTYIGDLEVKVYNGTHTWMVRDNEGGSADNINETRTEDSLFDGDNPVQSWYYRVRDIAAGDTGTLTRMQLYVYYDTPKPDLTPYQPSNWNDKIPIGPTQLARTDAHSYSGLFYDNQTLYFNWGSLNQGTADSGSYTVHVEVTGAGGGPWEWTVASDAVNWWYGSTTDQAVGPLSAGSHTFKVWVDYNNSVDEGANEGNNYYERTVSVSTAAPVEYYAECADNSNFSSPMNSGWIQQLQYTFSSLTPGQTYWYRVKARQGAQASGWSNVEHSQQEALPTVATPTISPNGGSYSGSVEVTLACTTSGATIRYTTDGSDPTGSSTAYSAPFTLTSSAPVKAKAFKSGYTDSATASASFTITAPPPQQLTGMYISNGVFHFLLNGPVGSNYVIQVSSNLVGWVPLLTNTIPVGGFLLINDPLAVGRPGRFYRAVLVNGQIVGTVIAWGDNTYGQTNIPPDLTNATAIATGYYHSLALKADGTVTCWGQNDFGQTNSPVGLSNVTAVAAGWGTSIALKSDGKLEEWGWGETNYGLGMITTAHSLSNVTAIAACWDCLMALKGDGTVFVWGKSAYGETNVPAGLSNATAIAGGGRHCMALKGDGTVVVWGGLTNVPTGLNNVRAIAGGGSHCLALKNDGSVVAWGDNSSGQTNVPPNLTNATSVSGGSSHSLALKNDGTVVGWGDNAYGQTNAPAGLINATAVSAGGYHNLAIQAGH